MSDLSQNPSAFQLKAAEVAAKIRLGKVFLVSKNSLDHINAFDAIFRPLEETLALQIGEIMIREGFRPNEPIIFVESVFVV